MDKKLQDLAWSLLPKEFREEVKRIGNILNKDASVMFGTIGQLSHKHLDLFVKLFGRHNLTSDAEEEDEILTVSRKKLQYFYEKLMAVGKSQAAFALQSLFGSKCLPDNDANEVNFASKESKFKVGDIASYVCSPTLKHKCTITEAIKNEHSGKWEYNVMFEWGRSGKWIPESDLEPYTEPAEPTCTDDCTDTCTDDCPSQSRNLSQETANCDKCNDLRLHIAAMALQGIMSASDPLMFSEKGCLSAEAIARQALKYAEALIAESEKGGRNEKV